MAFEELTDGSELFFNNNEVTSFTSELPKLTYGWGMFLDCSNLESFSSELPSLTNGWGMFYNCNLDKPSVINILTSIPNVNNGTIDIGTGYDYTKDEDTLRAIEEAKNKGWKVRLEFNG